jgi:competence protein ComEC
MERAVMARGITQRRKRERIAVECSTLHAFLERSADRGNVKFSVDSGNHLRHSRIREKLYPVLLLAPLLLAACGQTEENPFGPGEKPPPPGHAPLPAPLAFAGDQITWRSATPGIPRFEVSLPDSLHPSLFVWPAEPSEADTAGSVPVLGWPVGTRDSLDIAFFLEDEQGNERQLIVGRFAVRGTTPPAERSFLHATMIDVGWGDAHLIETPSGRRLLIDTGSGDNQASLQAFLDQHLVIPTPEGHRIDDLVLTHLHADHITGFEQTIVNQYDVGSVYLSVPHSPDYNYTYGRIRNKVLNSGAELLEPRSGDLLDVDPELTVTVLNAGNPFDSGSDYGGNENNSSMVLRLEYGDVRLIYTGDAETPLARQVESDWAGGLSANILKVGHHGSADATEWSWASTIDATVALVPIDASQVECALPRSDVIRILHNAGAMVFRSDAIDPRNAFERSRTGHVEVITDGHAVTVRTILTARPAGTDCG